MVGRTAERDALVRLLAETSTSGRALVIEGDAGIGKSLLLAVGAEWATANGFRRLDCCGLQSHTEVGFAGIHQLVHPVLASATALPARQRAALMTAFGLEDGPAPDRLLVGLAVLGLLEEAAAQRRLVLVIDDVQWLDQSSIDVLAFVARRLSNAPLVLLCAQRTTLDASAPQLVGLPRLPLEPLARVDAEALLDRSSPGTSPRRLDAQLARHVLDQAAGNPLAVLELGSAAADLADHRAVFTGEPLPTSRRVERAFLAQLDTLPHGSRTLLLLIAASEGTLTEISCAADGLDLVLTEFLGPLEHAGLVSVGGGRIRVRHPLIRSAVYGAATLASRVEVHRALADAATDSVRSAWHRAEATYGPDDRVAADLDAAAELARSRGAGAEASAAMRRSAALSTDPTGRVRRLVSAAEFARAAGLVAEAGDLLREAEPMADASSGLADLVVTQFVLNVTTATPGRSADELVALALRHPAGDERRRRLLWAAAIDCRMRGLPAHTRFAVAAALDPDDTSDPLTDIARALVDDTGSGSALAERLPDLVEALSDTPLASMSLAFAAEAITDRRSALRCWTHMQHAARRRGSPADECGGLRGTAQLLLVEGRIDAAAVAAETALRMAEDMNLAMTAGSAAAIHARALTWRGDLDGAREALSRARAHLAADPTILWHDDVHWAAGLSALAGADNQAALQHLSKMTLHRTSRRWAIADLAEAAAGCGEADAVRPFVADAEHQAKLLGIDSMLVHRAHAVLAGAAENAEDHFRAALRAGGQFDAALENARTHLLYGEWLRRRRRITDARDHLAVAVQVFHAAGAAPFRHRAAAELRAAGVAPAACPSAHTASEVLTPQEIQIAQMAADGLTNREIADRIYVSHRTVAAHLYKVFPKLGITSRNQLHAALSA